MQLTPDQAIPSRTTGATQKILLPIFLAIACLLVASQAQAVSGFNIQPLRLDMSARVRSSSLELTNLTDRDIPVQVKAYAWAQKDGKDVLTPTRDIFLAPPITNVKAGSRQVVRFRLKKGANQDVEKSYRIFIEQIPPADPTLRAAMEFRLSFSLPLFVAPNRYSDPQFGVTATKTAGGVNVTLENQGNIHVKVSNVIAYRRNVELNKLTASDSLGATNSSITGNSYVLPGTSQQWFIPMPATELASDSLRILLNTDYFNSSGKGAVQSSGLMSLPVDGKKVLSDKP